MALKWLRDKMKYLTWILWVVIAVFVLLVFFQWGGVNQMQTTRSQTAATVGDEVITYEEFQDAHRALEQRYRQIFGQQFDSQQFAGQIAQQSLRQVVERKILLMEARNVGLRVSDEEVRDAILEEPVFRDDQGNFVGKDEYLRILRSNRRSPEAFETSVREDLLRNKLLAVLGETAYVTDSEVEEAYREQAERAKIRYVHLPASEVGSDVTATQEELAAYYEAHRADYEVPAQRVVEYLLADTATLRREIEVPEAELKAYYDDHATEFTREEQVRARHILLKVTPDRPDAEAESQLQAVRQRIEGGEDFAAVAREVSEDEGSAPSGGNLGTFERGRMIKAFEDAAFGAQVGELVGPIKTDFGYHLIEVQDHLQGGLQPFEEVQGVVRARVVGERVEEISESKIRDVATRLAEKPEVADSDLATLATEEQLTHQTTEPFGRDDVIPGIGRVAEFNQQAFELASGAVSGPVKIPRGWLVLRVKEVREPRFPDLSEVTDKVQQAVLEEKREAAAVARLSEVRQQVAEGGGLDAVAAELGLEVQESEEFGRRDRISGLRSDRKVVEAALGLEAGEIGGPFRVDGGAALFEVTERQKFDPAKFADAKATTRESQETKRLSQLVAAVVELRRRDLAPQYDARLLESLGIEAPALGG